MSGRCAARRRGAARTRRTMPSQPHSTHQRRSSAGSSRSKNRLRIAVISPPQWGQNLPCGNSKYTTAVTIATRIATVASKTTTISMLNLSARPGGQLHLRSRSPGFLALPRPDELQDTPLQLRQLDRLYQHPFPRHRRVSRLGELRDVPRQKQDARGERRPGVFQRGEQLHATHPRHPQVGDDHIGLPPRAVQPRQGLCPVLSLIHPRPPADQELGAVGRRGRSEEHTSELQSQSNLVCRLLLEKKKMTHS